ncbi:hypothetical protein Ddye_009133 [Dipteronia dyeriana]|uniref:Uncharacterized protein n=1 Tax=Dipteronia dyeriana TaxID=168575 RepID=A0AAE0CM05_9ROSI|nr:hypothetical protein Ddye_009133 [Dipteronia dyeriana]
MAESESSRKIQKQLVSDSDMAMVTQQLIQRSDEGINRSSNGKNNISSDDDHDHQAEIDQRSRDEIIRKEKIEEIFGKEEEACRPKKRRYRSLVSIYRETKPIFREIYDYHEKKPIR